MGAININSFFYGIFWRGSCVGRYGTVRDDDLTKFMVSEVVGVLLMLGLMVVCVWAKAPGVCVRNNMSG